MGLINIKGDELLNILPKKIGFDGVQLIAETFLPKAIRDRLDAVLSTGIATHKEVKDNNKVMKKWSNPLEISLPEAPNMRIYCLYGVKKPTELGYIYKAQMSEVHNSTISGRINSADPDNLTVPIVIDSSVNDIDSDLSNGIIHSDGDGTVPLISLGFMCRHGWTNLDHLNPSKINVVTKEFEHEPSMVDLRGGPKTGDHVDILGNHEMLMDVMKIVSNYAFIKIDDQDGTLPQNRIISDIDEISEPIIKRIKEFHSSDGVQKEE